MSSLKAFVLKKKSKHCIGKQTDTYTYFLGISNFAKVPGKVKFILFYLTLDYSYKGYELLCQVNPVSEFRESFYFQKTQFYNCEMSVDTLSPDQGYPLLMQI